MKKEKDKVKIIPLGGLNEIGKNMTIIEYKEDIIVIDCGLKFPDEDMFGIDIVIPDVTYLIKNKEKVIGIYPPIADVIEDGKKNTLIIIQNIF